MTRLANETNEPKKHDRNEVTPEMLKAGVEAMIGELTADEYASGRNLNIALTAVYRAMASKSRHLRSLRRERATDR
jgi:hypothetical protein